MKTRMFTIYDAKAEAFMPPFFAQNTGLAVRMLRTTMLDGQHPFSLYPEDYALFDLGEFDQSGASFELLKSPVRVCTALELVPSTSEMRVDLAVVDGGKK